MFGLWLGFFIFGMLVTSIYNSLDEDKVEVETPRIRFSTIREVVEENFSTLCVDEMLEVLGTQDPDVREVVEEMVEAFHQYQIRELEKVLRY